MFIPVVDYQLYAIGSRYANLMSVQVSWGFWKLFGVYYAF